MRRAAVLVALALLSACAGVRPVTPVAANVTAPASWRANASANGAVSSDWWRGFGDAQLTLLVERALAANPDIAIAATRVAEARALYDLANAQLLPNLSFQAGGARQRDLSAFGTPLTQNAGRAELSISYDVDLFGRLSSASGAARASLLSSEAARANVRLAITATVIRGYFNLRALDGRLAILRDTLEVRAGAVRVQQRRADAGYSSRLELAQAEAEYQATAQLIPSVELAIDRQEGGLRVLLGQNPGAVPRDLDLIAITEPIVPASLPSELLRRRPDIIAAENDLVAAERSLDVSRAAFMPQIRISAVGGYVGSDALPDSPVDVFSLGASILAPIFDAGRLRAQQDVFIARRDRAAYAYQRAALLAFSEVEDALASVERTRVQEEALTLQRDALAHAFRLATNRYRAGYSTYLEQLDAQRGLLAANLQLVQVRTDRLNATVALYQAMGGGWAP